MNSVRLCCGSNLETVHTVQSWRGIPTKLNSTPHSREIRDYFYRDVCEATKNAVEEGLHKLKV